MKLPLIALTVVALVSAVACGEARRAAADAGPDDDIDAGPMTPDARVGPDAGPPIADAVDILFVMDNSATMAEEQASVTQNLSAFISTLETAAGGRPSLHLGVISTDLGAGPFQIQACSGNGDDGILQNAPQGPCTPPDDRFIKDEIDGAGRIINYPAGQLADTFSCIAQLGTIGCGFEQPLEAMRRALDGSRPENQGFVRDGALLAIVYLGDEDDCSAKNVELFDTDETKLGPISSYRCFKHGVVCDPDDDTVGSRSNCRPRDDSQYLFGVSDYIDFLVGRKPPERLVVAGIIGPASPVNVGLSSQGNPQLEPSCVSAAGEAVPAVRLQALLDAFPTRSASLTICNEDLTSALLEVAQLIADNLPE